MVFRLCSQGVHIVPERSISRRRPSLCKASASKHMHSLLCSPTLGMACHGHCEAFLAGSSVPGLTAVLVRVVLCCVGQQDRNALWSVRASDHSSFSAPWHSRHASARCCCCVMHLQCRSSTPHLCMHPAPAPEDVSAMPLLGGRKGWVHRTVCCL